jgi:phage I-like protein
VIAASGNGADLPIDYEHQIDDPAQREKGGHVRAAGWIKELQIRDDGIWCRVEWTRAARNMIAAREYRYISPVLIHTLQEGRVIKIQGASLVHRPNLHLQSLSSEQVPGAGAAVMAGQDMGMIASALGLQAGADIATILATIAARLAPAPAPAPDPTKYVPIAAVVELMSERNSTMALLSEREATTMVDDAVIGGYITPAMKPWAVALCTQDPASFKSFMASSAPAYAHFFKGHKFAPLDVPDAAPATDVAMMAEQLGLDPKSFG